MILRGMHPGLSVMVLPWTLIKEEAKSRFYNLVPTFTQAQLSMELRAEGIGKGRRGRKGRKGRKGRGKEPRQEAEKEEW